MASIYAITKGDYSDYHIITLTTNKEKAKRLATLYSDEYGEAKIEIYEDGDPNDTRILYKVIINPGKAATVEIAPEYDFNNIQNKVIKEKGFRNTFYYAVLVLADDEKHALKIARDLVAETRYKIEIEEAFPNE